MNQKMGKKTRSNDFISLLLGAFVYSVSLGGL
jgi:hypothetical protein